MLVVNAFKNQNKIVSWPLRNSWKNALAIWLDKWISWSLMCIGRVTRLLTLWLILVWRYLLLLLGMLLLSSFLIALCLTS
jgi:hypothetical protein